MIFENKSVIKFMEKFEYSENNCWEWKACKNYGGYGVMRVNKINILATHFIWIFLHGDIPDNKIICHRCDNPGCINPSHLFLGDHNDNVQDMIKKGRARKARGIAVNTNKLNENQVIEIRKMYFENNIMQKDIAKKYNVTPNAIRAILIRKSWKWL